MFAHEVFQLFQVLILLSGVVRSERVCARVTKLQCFLQAFGNLLLHQGTVVESLKHFQNALHLPTIGKQTDSLVANLVNEHAFKRMQEHVETQMLVCLVT